MAKVGDEPMPPRQTRREVLRGGAVALLPAGVLTGCAGVAQAHRGAVPGEASLGSRFAIAVLPDTQFYSRYATQAEGRPYARRFGSEPFMAQTSWAAAQAAALNIAFLIHLGDVVDQVDQTDEWKAADQAMRVLETGRLPYSILAGNHDVLEDEDYEDARSQASGTDAQRELAREPYLHWFAPSRAQRQPSFGGRDPSGFHEWHVFHAEGQRFMVMSLSWRASDAAIDWARRVIASRPEVPVILVNHQLLNIGKDGISPRETAYGLMLWDRLIRDNDQIFLTLNGHHHGSARLTKVNDFGNPVEQVVVDYQMAYQGGNGLMRLLEFDLSHGRIDVLSFSPWVVMKPPATLTAFDQAVLNDPPEQASLVIDFPRRFARFNPGFAPGPSHRPPIIEQARRALLSRYAGPIPVIAREPRGPDDYPKVASTVAHWRFVGGHDGVPLAPGQVIADVGGGRNPLRREASEGAQAGDLAWSSERHRLSAAPGSVRFVGTDKRAARLSCFLTGPDAPLNRMEFADTGYTVEAFIKIDRSWSKTLHAWMNLLTREGRRGSIAGFPRNVSDPEAPPLMFALSSLREVQWEVVPARPGKRHPQASWSGEIPLGTWLHVAVVGDPSVGRTTLHIEGVPMLRSAGDGSGLAAAGASMPWVVGAGGWDGKRTDGWLGSIGEIRIAAEPLPPSLWLTARPG